MQAAIQAALAKLEEPTSGIASDPLLISHAWQIVTDHLTPHDYDGVWDDYQPSDAAVDAAKVLSEAGLDDDLLDWYLDTMKRSFRVIKAQTNACLDEFERVTGPAQPQLVSQLLQYIGMSLWRWQQPVPTFWPAPHILSHFRDTFLSNLYLVLPPRFAPALSTYLLALLRLGSPSFPQDPAQPLVLPTLLLLLDRYDPLLFALVYGEIEATVRRECAGRFEGERLRGLLGWLHGDMFGWVSGVYEQGKEGGLEEARKFLKPTFARFEYHVHKVLGQIRINELYDIILDYPNSKPALDDLKVCLYKTDQRSSLVNHLRHQINSRLLHPGSDTKQIILHYIATIRCLRLVEPQGVLLSRVAEPIRKYLRGREDTIRCIVLSMIEEGSELVEELAVTDARPVHDQRDEAENYNDNQWQPDPIDAPPDFRKSKSADVIQLLVSIYPTKDLFIKELQVLLAQRLLALSDFAALAREVKNVDVLKLRFGDQNLHGCEVMIKDLQDSRTTDLAVRAALGGEPDAGLHARIVSRLFWPSFQAAGLALPGQLGRMQRYYTRAYVGVKPDKKLKWIPQLGTVNVTVELADRAITTDCTPLQAAIAELFAGQDTWTTEDLAIEMGVMDNGLVRNGLYFWNNLGVLKGLPGDEWLLLEEKDEGTEAGAAHVIEAAAEAVQSVEAQQVEQMRVYWQFVKGMLSNLGSASASKIHSTLSMVVPTYKGKTVDELSAFLEVMLAEGLVTKTEKGNWKIVR